MKRVKKLLSLVLAMMLVLAMGSTAMAAGELPDEPAAVERGTITINNAIEEQTYTIYKILDLESYNADNNAYLYKVADGWQEFVKGAGSAYLQVDDDGYVTWKSGVSADKAAEFAKAAVAYAKENSIPSAKEPVKAEGTTVTFTDLDLGYYLLDSDTGALCSLDTTNPNVEIQEKNEKPTIDKDVEQPTASVGDILDYIIKIKIAPGAENYKVHDQMSDGLTFDSNSVAVKVLSKETVDGLDASDKDAVKNAQGTGLTEGGDYTLSAPADDGHTFDITFADSLYAKLPVGGMIVITYQAAINADAIKFDKVNNKATLDFGDNNDVTSTETPEVPTRFTEINILKYTMKDAAELGLAGAEFTLSKNEDGTDPINFVDLGDGNYRAATAEEVESTEVKTTSTVVSPKGEGDALGRINLDGLGEGTYYLKETKAPSGYNQLKAPVKIVISPVVDKTTGEVTGLTVQIETGEGDNVVLENANPVKVENNTGAELPSTGGIGTTIFYVLGGILVVGAGIMLVVKKRMSSEK